MNIITIKKKAQSMSLNTIVIAALVVLVLIVLSVIFIRNSGNFVNTVNSCASQNGKCAIACGDPVYGTEKYTVQRSNVECPKEEDVCCLPIGE